jgi:hypothetical protein
LVVSAVNDHLVEVSGDSTGPAAVRLRAVYCIFTARKIDGSFVEFVAEEDLSSG